MRLVQFHIKQHLKGVSNRAKFFTEIIAYIRVKAFLILFILTSSIVNAIASDTIILRDNTKEIPITRNFVDYFEDQTGKLKIREILKLSTDSHRFQRSTANDFINKNTKSAYWLKFTIIDSTLNKGNFLIEMFDFDIDEVNYYYPETGGNYVEEISGFNYPFSSRKIDHKNIIFPVAFEKRGPVTLYMRFKSQKLNLLEPILRCTEKFIDYSLDEYILFGIFYGIMFLIIFYNLLYLIILRKSYYLFYVIYASSIMFYMMRLNGTGFQYVWPDSYWINDYLPAICLGLGTTSMLFFFLDFFGLKNKYKNIYDTIRLMIVIRIILMVIHFFIPNFTYAHLVDILYTQVIFYFGTRLYSSGVKSTRWFIIAYSTFNFFFIISFLEIATLIPSSIITVYAIYLGIILQFFFMSVGMAEAVREVYNDKNKAQSDLIVQFRHNELLKEKVNRELEEKVKERTLELEKAKREIEKKAEENLQMNIALDLANNKLQKHLTSFAQSVVMNTHVDFEAFKKAYPDDLSCMRYLSEIKEKNGFSCKMCGNNKSIKGKAKFDIRCSKCNYNESITANTIFHKTKFSLQKAFYLLYLVSQTKTEIASSELSKILDLQKATCQNFKNKITDKMAVTKKGNKNQPVSWDLLILDKEVLISNE